MGLELRQTVKNSTRFKYSCSINIIHKSIQPTADTDQALVFRGKVLYFAILKINYIWQICHRLSKMNKFNYCVNHWFQSKHKPCFSAIYNYFLLTVSYISGQLPVLQWCQWCPKRFGWLSRFFFSIMILQVSFAYSTFQFNFIIA